MWMPVSQGFRTGAKVFQEHWAWALPVEMGAGLVVACIFWTLGWPKQGSIEAEVNAGCFLQHWVS